MEIGELMDRAAAVLDCDVAGDSCHGPRSPRPGGVYLRCAEKSAGKFGVCAGEGRRVGGGGFGKIVAGWV